MFRWQDNGAMSLHADDLLLFSRVVEAGSFSRAAERLGWPKSSVSRRVAALEQRLGEKLLQRTTRKLALTDFGASLLEHARGVAAEVDEALALALHRQARPSGRLRVSMPGDVAATALPAMLARFAEDFPDVALELDLSPRRVDLIGEGFDLALRMGDLPDDSHLAARRVATFATGLFAAPAFLARHGEPQLPEALTHLHGLMLPSRGEGPRPWRLRPADAAAGPAVTVMPRTHTVANSPDALLRIAAAGGGIATAAELFAQGLVDSGALVRVLPGWCLEPGTAWAVFPGRRLMPAKTRVFLDALVAALGGCSEADNARLARYALRPDSPWTPPPP